MVYNESAQVAELIDRTQFSLPFMFSVAVFSEILYTFVLINLKNTKLFPDVKVLIRNLAVADLLNMCHTQLSILFSLVSQRGVIYRLPFWSPGEVSYHLIKYASTMLAVNRLGAMMSLKRVQKLFKGKVVYIVVAVFWTNALIHVTYGPYVNCLTWYNGGSMFWVLNCAPFDHDATMQLIQYLSFAWGILDDFVCITTMISSYVGIFVYLKWQASKSSALSNDAELAKRQKMEMAVLFQGALIALGTLICMLSWIVCIFVDGLCYTNQHQIVTSWLVLLNSVINPPLLILFNSQLRDIAKKMLKKMVGKIAPGMDAPTTTQVRAVTRKKAVITTPL